VIALVSAAIQGVRKAGIDWIGLLILFGLSLIVILLVLLTLRFRSKPAGLPDSTTGKISDSPATLVFSPLQMEAFELAKEVRTLHANLPRKSTHPAPNLGVGTAEANQRLLKDYTDSWKPWEAAVVKARAEYSLELAPQVKQVVLKLRKHGCSSYPEIERFFEDIHGEAFFEPVHDTLIALAHELDGVKLLVTTYPRNM